MFDVLEEEKEAEKEGRKKKKKKTPPLRHHVRACLIRSNVNKGRTLW